MYRRAKRVKFNRKGGVVHYSLCGICFCVLLSDGSCSDDSHNKDYKKPEKNRYRKKGHAKPEKIR